MIIVIEHRDSEDNKTEMSSIFCVVVKIIVSKVASTPDEVAMYAQCTLLAASLAASHEGSSSKINAVQACVEYLRENEFIAQRAATDSGNLFLHVFSTLYQKMGPCYILR